MKITPFLQNSGSLKQLLALLLICLISLSLVSFLTILFAPAFGIGLTELQGLESRMAEPQVLSFMKFSQTLSAIGMFLIPPFILMTLIGKPPAESLRLNTKPPLNLLVSAAVMMVIALPLINASALLNSELSFPAGFEAIEQKLRLMEEAAAGITQSFLKMNGFTDLLIMLFVMAVLPGIGEELLFRSTIQPLLSRLFRNHHAGIWITAFLFSFIHFQFFGFIPRFLIGAFLGYLFYYSSNSWIPATAHFVNNGLAVTASWLAENGMIQSSPDELGVGNYALIQCLIAAILLSAGMLYFIRHSPVRKLSLE